MSRDGSGVYTLPSGSTATTGATILASTHNTPLQDLEADANAARPVVAGGTGATSEAGARDSLEVSGKVISKSAAYTALPTDRSKLIRGTAAYTLSLTAAATLGDGWFIDVEAATGDTTIDPNASETIDGAATFTVPQGDTVRVRCNGTAFYTQFHEKAADVNARTLVVTGGSASAFTISAPSTIASYQTGQKFLIRAHTANAVGATLNVDGLGAKNLRRYYVGAKTQLNSGHLQTDSMFEVTYDGTDFIVTSGLSGDGERVGLVKVVDEDDFASNTSAWPPSQQSTKAYVDTQVTTMGGNQSGSAPVFAARAWVNFNGTGTVAIRDSGNVSSITDNGTGNYTINFTTAMPSANYAVVMSYTDEINVEHGVGFVVSQTASSVTIKFHNTANSADTVDKSIVSVVVFG